MCLNIVFKILINNLTTKHCVPILYQGIIGICRDTYILSGFFAVGHLAVRQFAVRENVSFS